MCMGSPSVPKAKPTVTQPPVEAPRQIGEDVLEKRGQDVRNRRRAVAMKRFGGGFQSNRGALQTTTPSLGGQVVSSNNNSGPMSSNY